MKKIIAAIIALAGISVGVYILFFTGEHFPAVKKLIIINRGVSLDGSFDFTLSSADQVKEITDSSSLSLVHKMKRLRGMYIVKDYLIGKAITLNNDTLNITIAFPGAIITGHDTKKQYGFKNGKNRELLQELLSFD
ncbi:MAG: hypothetical protein JNM88_19975 [Chitinophagaceae bacterium]|nr:hypothetical protein [Chitinophagaceae bacterium]